MTLSLSQEIRDAVAQNAPIAIGVSGGKDSCAVALAMKDYLDSIGYQGQVMLIHSDLGIVEWKDSLPTCHRISKATGYPLVVVRRSAGGMMERWEQRWENNLTRYNALECVKLILPWSTPSMRFCTSELKSAVIASELKKVLGGRGIPILSVTGIRADESSARAKQPVSKRNPRLDRKSDKTWGIDWNAIHHWTEAEVFAYLERKGFVLHEAYRVFGSSRVSCAFCIMSSAGDLRASISCPDNLDLYVRMVRLELRSSFAFQSKWLCDLAPDLLPDDLRAQIGPSKARAERRKALEALIPRGLEYEKGWPTRMPTPEEAQILASIRGEIGTLYAMTPSYLTPGDVLDRYAALMRESGGDAQEGQMRSQDALNFN